MKKRGIYNAVLENWKIMPVFNGNIIHGTINGDDKGRFIDGDVIYTSNLVGNSSLVEGDIALTRNTRYLLGKQRGEKFDDGHVVNDTFEEQMNSLRGYMRARGYVLVYSDSSVFWRLEPDSIAHRAFNQVAFATGVKWYNAAAPFPGRQRYYATAFEMREFRKLKKVKLQKSGNRIVVQSHKISSVMQPISAQQVTSAQSPWPVALYGN